MVGTGPQGRRAWSSLLVRSVKHVRASAVWQGHVALFDEQLGGRATQAPSAAAAGCSLAASVATAGGEACERHNVVCARRAPRAASAVRPQRVPARGHRFAPYSSSLRRGTLFLSEPMGLQEGDVSGSLANANYVLGVLFFTCIML